MERLVILGYRMEKVYTEEKGGYISPASTRLFMCGGIKLFWGLPVSCKPQMCLIRDSQTGFEKAEKVRWRLTDLVFACLLQKTNELNLG